MMTGVGGRRKHNRRDPRAYGKVYREFRNRKTSFERILERIRMDHLVNLLTESNPGRILEIGCGPNPVCRRYMDFQSYTAVECDPGFAAEVKRLARHGRDIVVLEAFFEDVNLSDLENRGFDAIIMSSVLHEFQDPARCLEIVRSLCTPETSLYLNVPNMNSFHRLLALEMGFVDDLYLKSDRAERLQQTAKFSPASLSEFLSESGFRVIRTGTYFIKPFTHDQMERLLAEGIVDVSIIAGLDRMTRHIPEMGCEIFAVAKIQ